MKTESWILEERELDHIPFDKVFEVLGNEELCHATGFEVFDGNCWWNEYIDSMADLHYGR